MTIMAKEIKYEVKEKLGVISQDGTTTKELRLVSWNDRDAKYDIRGWYIDDKEQEKCGKGIALSEDELKKLGKVIIEAFGVDNL